MCTICLEICDQLIPVEPCQHAFACVPCLEAFLRKKLETREPVRCDHITGHNQLCMQEVSMEWIKTRHGLLELALRHEKWQLLRHQHMECPHCHELQPTGPAPYWRTCTLCAQAFCQVHGRSHGELDPCIEEKLDAATLLATHLRRCPSPTCEALLEKTGGCNHMRCSNCQQHFCWSCGHALEGLTIATHFLTGGCALLDSRTFGWLGRWGYGLYVLLCLFALPALVFNLALAILLAPFYLIARRFSPTWTSHLTDFFFGTLQVSFCAMGALAVVVVVSPLLLCFACCTVFNIIYDVLTGRRAVRRGRRVVEAEALLPM